ncbi:hypothetical protein KPL76_01920 [Subtercola sp. PAMC28395]|uniref:hypothetical protein n=1 Tax=Subtercola sp. PAMC28395 TaxID=2846775 RepID=UPI001C0B3185|nr:hypothetical protein [Subtercola sp. PAMC28395]QWT24209.1 hypothetical protein KPL76_01920 [Subtercola sp. PAMC28395]
MPAYLTSTATANQLEVSPKALLDLIAAELIPEPLTIGRQKLFEAETITRFLEERTEASRPRPPGYVVRVHSKMPAKDDDERKWIGYAQTYDAGLSQDENDAIRRNALRAWWPVREPSRYVGQVLVATLASFVVATYRIDGFTEGYGRVSFRVSEAPRDAAEILDGHRLRMRPGPISLPLEP